LSLKKDQLDILLSPDHIIDGILKIHRSIRRYIRQSPKLAFKPMWLGTNGKLKLLAPVDLLAERMFMDALMTRFGKDNIFVIGEESLSKGVDLSSETRMSVLIDMIDGTDLLQRGFSNWCSAITFFQPNEKKIKGAFVALPSDYIYYATDDRSGAYKKRLSQKKEEQEVKLAGPLRTRKLRDASVCMYSQKSESLLKLLSLNNQKRFIKWLSEITETERNNRDSGKTDNIGFRFYNLAGNPMMVKLAERVVDIVVELKGQAPHDVVPGAFIAIKAGAVLGKVTGEDFSIAEISDALLRPSDSRLRYILAANEPLFNEFRALLRNQ